jgi:hypothetical protein
VKLSLMIEKPIEKRLKTIEKRLKKEVKGKKK